MAKKKAKTRRPRKRNARRPGITKAQYKKLLREVRRRKNAGPFSFRKTKKALKKRGFPRRGTKRFKHLMKHSAASKEAARVLAYGNPTRKGKTGRWYKGPRGVKVRVRRSRGKFVVDLR